MGRATFVKGAMCLLLALPVFMEPSTAFADDDDTIHKCRIIEVLRPGQRESNRYIIRGYSRRGRKIDVFRAEDGRPYNGLQEAEIGLFLLVEEGSCPE